MIFDRIFYFSATVSFEQFYLMGLSIGKRNVEKSCRGNENKSSFIWNTLLSKCWQIYTTRRTNKIHTQTLTLTLMRRKRKHNHTYIYIKEFFPSKWQPIHSIWNTVLTIIFTFSPTHLLSVRKAQCARFDVSRKQDTYNSITFLIQNVCLHMNIVFIRGKRTRTHASSIVYVKCTHRISLFLLLSVCICVHSFLHTHCNNKYEMNGKMT